MKARKQRKWTYNKWDKEKMSNKMVALIQDISPIIFELIRLNILLTIKDNIEYNWIKQQYLPRCCLV